jgi:membrane protein
MSKPKAVLVLMKDAFQAWDRDGAARWAAAVAYYTIFSLAPLLIIVIAVAGAVFGQEAARGEIVQQIGGLVGPEGARVVEGLLESAGQRRTGLWASVLGLLAVFIGATGVFGALQNGLNNIWEVRPKPMGLVRGLVRVRIISFAMVLTIGFILLLSLVVSAGLEALGNFAADLLPGQAHLWRLLNVAVSFGIITLLFAMVYVILPDAEIAWRDVWLGAAVTSVLFSLGKFLIGLYLGNSSFASVYGAAGALVIFLFWVYYSAQIFFLGAEFTQVYANRYGRRIVPSPHATRFRRVAVTEEGEVLHRSAAPGQAPATAVPQVDGPGRAERGLEREAAGAHARRSAALAAAGREVSPDRPERGAEVAVPAGAYGEPPAALTIPEAAYDEVELRGEIGDGRERKQERLLAAAVGFVLGLLIGSARAPKS